MTGLLSYILITAGMYKMFEKADVPGWKAIIPFYNLWQEVKIVNRSPSFFWYMTTPLILLLLIVTIWWVIGFLGSSPMGISSSVAGESPFALAVLTFIFFAVSLPMQVVLIYDLSKSFGKGIGTTIGLFLLPVVFYPILGFGDSLYSKIERDTQDINDKNVEPSALPEPSSAA